MVLPSTELEHPGIVGEVLGGPGIHPQQLAEARPGVTTGAGPNRGS